VDEKKKTVGVEGGKLFSRWGRQAPRAESHGSLPKKQPRDASVKKKGVSVARGKKCLGGEKENEGATWAIPTLKEKTFKKGEKHKHRKTPVPAGDKQKNLKGLRRSSLEGGGKQESLSTIRLPASGKMLEKTREKDREIERRGSYEKKKVSGGGEKSIVSDKTSWG